MEDDLGMRVAKLAMPAKKEASTVLPDLASTAIQPRSNPGWCPKWRHVVPFGGTGVLNRKGGL
jgi:hypothetical protein